MTSLREYEGVVPEGTECSVEIEGMDMLKLNEEEDVSTFRRRLCVSLEEAVDDEDEESSDGSSSLGLLSESYAADSVAMVRRSLPAVRRRRMSNGSDYATDSVELYRSKKAGVPSVSLDSDGGKDRLELTQVLKLGDRQAIDVKSLVLKTQVPPPSTKGLQPKRISNSAA